MHLGAERDQPEDALVDYMIALEAILMADGNKPDIRYRLALRGAAACASGPDERAEVFQAIWSDYNLRSRILHGGPRPPTFAASLALAVSKCESLLRTLLREYVTRWVAVSEKKFVKAVEEAIIRGERPCPPSDPAGPS